MRIEKMYMNKGNKLTQRQRFGILKHWNNGRKIAGIARLFRVSRRTVYHVIDRFREDGAFGIEDHKPGPLPNPLSTTFYALVCELYLLKDWGACKQEKYFKAQGFSVSHNKINQVIQLEGLTRKKMGKRDKPKYIRYEADANNDQWHMDWSVDPLSKRHILAIIDDKSRFVVFVGLFDSADAENTITGLSKAISTYGTPKEIVTDNGSHFKNIHTGKPCEPLKRLEERHGINHIFIRPHHPQSNGKIERWFGSYKTEFPRMHYSKVTDLLTWAHYYNFERIHQSLDYKTPAHVYLGVKSI